MNVKKAIITLGLVLLSITGLNGCGMSRELTEISGLTQSELKQDLLPSPIPVPEEIAISANDSSEDNTAEAQKLTALADTLEEAQEIADLYEIELTAYSYGVATYTTDKDIQELVNLGLENGYPTLSPNYKSRLYNAQ